MNEKKNVFGTLSRMLMEAIAMRVDELLDGEGITIVIRRARPDDKKTNDTIDFERTQERLDLHWDDIHGVIAERSDTPSLDNTIE